MARNNYELLGVGADADKDAINRAYRRAALTCHPDKHQGDAAKVEMFRQIGQAKEALLKGLNDRARAPATISLSTGCIKAIFETGGLQNSPTGTYDVQAYRLARIPGSGSGTAERYRVRITDGVFSLEAILATQLAELVSLDKLRDYSVVRLRKASVSMISDRKIITILALDVIGQLDSRVGNPTHIGGTVPAPSAAAPQPVQSTHAPPHHHVGRGDASSGGYGGSRHSNIVPIRALNPYNSHWTIKARVTSKSGLRQFNGKRGPGQLFSVNLVDVEGGEIRATFFSAAVDKFFSLIEINGIYLISGGAVKQADQRYSTLNSAYELTIFQNSDITRVQGAGANEIPLMSYNFVPIARIADLPAGAMVDVIGCITATGELTSINTKQGQLLSKRVITLIDDSRGSIEVTLWGPKADAFSGSGVIAIKSAKVSDFRGKSLGTLDSSQITLNPDLPEAHRVRTWYTSTGQSVAGVPISSHAGGRPSDHVRTIDAIKRERLGECGKVSYFDVKGSIRHIRNQRMWYMACPTEDCSKKVENRNGAVWCEKCRREFAKCSYRYVLGFSIADFTSTCTLSAFNDAGTKIIGHTAAEMVVWKESHDAAYERAIKRALFKMYRFKCRAKEESFNGETQVTVTVMSLEPIDYAAEGRRLLNEIRCYGVQV